MENYYINGKKIIFETGAVVEFDFPISKTRPFNNKIITLIAIPEKTLYNQNVFAVNFKGEIIWQIEKSGELDKIGNCPFVSIEIKNMELACFNRCGFRFTVHPATGRITSKIFISDK